MIYLYTLPGINLTYPEITNPMIKGALNLHDIKCKHIDLTLNFIDILCKNKEINKCFKKIKDKDMLFENTVENNYRLMELLRIYFDYYDIDYSKKGLFFRENLSTIDKAINFIDSKSVTLFDSVFINDYLKDGDFVYINIAYHFQLPFALKFIKSIKNMVNVKVIVGGNYLTHIRDNVNELMEKFSLIDAVFFYAEYDSLYKIIECFQNNKELCDCDCIVRINGDLVHSKANYINKIEVALPDFNDLDLNKYLSKYIVIPLLTSKGCYYGKCNFCAHHSFYKLTKFKYRKNL